MQTGDRKSTFGNLTYKELARVPLVKRCLQLKASDEAAITRYLLTFNADEYFFAGVQIRYFNPRDDARRFGARTFGTYGDSTCGLLRVRSSNAVLGGGCWRM